jgi:hypothetical protein
VSSTLSNGYKLPATGDRGSVFYPDLEDNITLMNSHAHTGSDGETIDVKYLSKTTATIASGSWSAVSGQAGTFRQLITMPAGFDWDAQELKFTLSTLGHVIHPSVEKVSATTYYVYINDSSLALKVTYG